MPTPKAAAIANAATSRYTRPRAPNPIRAITVSVVTWAADDAEPLSWGMVDKRAKIVEVLYELAIRS